MRADEANLYPLVVRRLARDWLCQWEWQHSNQRAGQDEVQGTLQVRPLAPGSTKSPQGRSWWILRGSAERQGRDLLRVKGRWHHPDQRRSEVHSHGRYTGRDEEHESSQHHDLACSRWEIPSAVSGK